MNNKINIKGLTLIRPWAWAILHAGKSIENRTWKPSASQLSVGDWIAIHAGAKWSQEDADWIGFMFNTKVPPKDEHPSVAIVGVARYAGVITSKPIGWPGLSAEWFVGPYGWRFSAVLAIAPIPHKGAMGLWELQPEAYKKVSEQLRVNA